MTSFHATIKAFQQSQISFDELLTIAKKIDLKSDQPAGAAFQLLKDEYHAGKLSNLVYLALTSVLNDEARANQYQPTQQGFLFRTGDDATRINRHDASISSNSGGFGVYPHAALKVGSRLKDRFVLQALLGTGGMGSVFKAIDLRKVEAKDQEPFVALKILNQSFQAHPMALVALQRETKRAQTLSHPNIIKVYDFDRDGAHVFMTMEYLKGKPLSHLIKKYSAVGGLPYASAWPVIHAMAEALGYAHQKNIVHSDFKPANVFMNENGAVQVLDFGIACAISCKDKACLEATLFDARVLGALTPAYASLEQLKQKAPDPRDDIYALACVSYELLTGKHPFGGFSSEKAFEMNLKAKPIAQLSRRQWKGLQKALSFQQSQRTADIEAFLKDIGPHDCQSYRSWGIGMVGTCLLLANLYWGFIAPATIVEPFNQAVIAQSSEQQKIKYLMELAGIHADVGYLIAPTGHNALWAYQEVLKIDPDNQQAMAGIEKIAEILEQQAWDAYEKTALQML